MNGNNLYLLDANVLIDANRDYYPLERVPQFWNWLIRHGTADRIKVPLEIWDEIKKGKKDDLSEWIKQTQVSDALLLQEQATPQRVSQVVEQGYANNLTDIEIEHIGRDPFLIAYALAAPARSRHIVTTEVSRPRRKRDNRHIPDVCESLSIPCINTFHLIRTLDFRTSNT